MTPSRQAQACARRCSVSGQRHSARQRPAGTRNGERQHIPSGQDGTEVLKAQERRLRLDKMKGELIDRGKATAMVFKLAREERVSWVNWPARVAALIAAELAVDAGAVQKAWKPMSAPSRRAHRHPAAVPLIWPIPAPSRGRRPLFIPGDRGLKPDPQSHRLGMGRPLSGAGGPRLRRARPLSHQPHALHAGDHGCAVARQQGPAHRIHEGRAGRGDRSRKNVGLDSSSIRHAGRCWPCSRRSNWRSATRASASIR